MFKRRLGGKPLGLLLLMLVSVCVSASAQLRSGSWVVNPYDYRYDMSLYFSLASPEYENLDQYEVGAFVGDECRGLAEKFDMPDGGTCMYMRIRSNSAQGEEVTFKMRDKATDETVVLKGADGQPFMFKADEMVGMPSDPYALIRYFNVAVEAGQNGSVEFENGLYAEGTVLELVAVPDEGYHFEIWSDGVQDAERTITVTGNIELSATFAVSIFNAVFKVGDEVIATLEVAYGEAVTAPEAPEREGYTFDGWSDIPETMPAHDIEILGSYTVNVYQALFKIEDEVIATLEVAYGEAVTAPEAPEREGYTFDGWSNIPETMPAHDIEILGSYTVNVYQALFKIEDEVIATLEVAYGEAVAAPEAPEREGYTFAGWTDIPETMPAHDIEILGSYTVNIYNLKVYLNNAVYMNENLEFGAAIVIPDPEMPDDMIFNGWQEEIPATMPAHDVVIHGSSTSSIDVITVDNDSLLTVYTVGGVLLYKDIKVDDAKHRLAPGLYIINGHKVMVK